MDFIPFNSLGRHVAPMQASLAEAANAVIGSGHFVLGPHVARFEQEFAAFCGASHCIGVANGTDALELSLKAVGVGPGDSVAVAANAAMYGTSAILAAGAEPVFVDVESDHGTMDPARFEEVLARTPGMRAVIVTHLYGRLANIDAIIALSQPARVAVVEDCAQAHGARLSDGRRAGAIGDVGSFSFYPTKNLGALGDGGGIVTNDKGVAERAICLRQYGWTQKYTNGMQGGRNSRLDELQAAMLSVMLPFVDAWNTRRREIANRYSSAITHPQIKVPKVAGEEYVGHLYVVQTSRRDALRAHLAASGIQSEIHYPHPDHRQPCHKGRYDQVSLPVTEWVADQVLSLPCFPELGDAEVQQVIEACNRF